jgi:hypothetical protein
MSRTVGIAKALDVLSEAEWSAQLFSRSSSRPGVAVQCGWQLAYHTFRSVKSPTGFPDWVLARERLIFVELKTETGKPSDAQREWLDGLARAGAEAYVWRPTDLDEIARILGKHWDLTYGAERYLSTHIGDKWTPRSLWTPGLGRADTTEQQQLPTKGAA